MKIAVIESGAKQYLVSPGDKIKVEKLSVKEGDKIDFNNVLLINNDGKTVIGTPVIKGAKVTGDVLKQGRLPKVTLTKYKAKERQRVHKGHKQPFTEIKIVDIVEK
ncbi:MAG: 50S ribosomal protein L21 [bacterium]|nr:50S ribosomal protein L21 [bacterium]